MSFFDPGEIVSNGGLLLIGLMVFAESGLLFGVIFPGDTLLFAAGFFAAQGQFSIAALLAVLVFSSALGGQVGYVLGQKFGPKIFTRKDGIFFRKEYIRQSEKFYEKHGGKTIMLARFVPIVRTFAPVVAGVGNMSKVKFTIFNLLGSGIWACSITLAGYWLGSQFPHLADDIEKVFILALPFIFFPPIYHFARDPVSRKKIISKFKRG
jgi:membrane-associated protein